MFMRKYHSAKPVISENDVTAVAEVLLSEHLEEGEWVRQFEGAISSYLQKEYAICTVNGFSSIHILMLSLGVGKGDEVIIPSYCCPAVLYPIKLLGATPRFADIANNSFNMSAESISVCYTKKTKAILFPYMFGFAAAIDDVISAFPQTFVIEDIAQSLGVEYKKKPLGSYSDYAASSFYASKMITCGDGGMLLTSRKEVYNSGREYVYYGHRKGKQEIGYNYHLSNLNAALGISQFKKLGKFISERQVLAATYKKNFSADSRIQSDFAFSNESGFLKFPILLETKSQRDQLKLALLNKGVNTGYGVLEALHQKEQLGEIHLPNTESFIDRVLCLPIYPSLTIEDVNFISEVTISELKKNSR
jgi:perosamine synthetase